MFLIVNKFAQYIKNLMLEKKKCAWGLELRDFEKCQKYKIGRKENEEIEPTTRRERLLSFPEREGVSRAPPL